MPPPVPASGPKPRGGKNCGANKGCFDASLIIISGSILDPYRPFWIFVEVTAEYSFPDFRDFLVLKPACKALKMTNAQVVETSVTVNNNSPTQDYVHPKVTLH